MPHGTPPHTPSSFHALPGLLRAAFVRQTALILDGHERVVGSPLVARTGDACADASTLYAAPFAVLSHGVETDPILNYANATALELWETTPQALLALPSRLTAEPMAQEAREKLLAEVSQRGFVTGYAGVRISATGSRFTIKNVTIWNLTDAAGGFAGQAAAFDRWSPL